MIDLAAVIQRMVAQGMSDVQIAAIIRSDPAAIRAYRRRLSAQAPPYVSPRLAAAREIAVRYPHGESEDML